MRLRWPLAGNHEQHIRHCPRDLHQHPQNEINIFFVCDARNVHKHWSIGGDAVRRPKARPIATPKARRIDPRGQDVGTRHDAIIT